MTRILLTGGTGQLGWELRRTLAVTGPIEAPPRTEMDLARAGSVTATLDRVQPDVIVNAAAYTAVDRAESEPAEARSTNTDGPALLASWAREHGALLVHFSTEYVFDGAKPEPYAESDPPQPLNTYGSTKLAGEKAVEEAGGDHLILRTSWLFAGRGRNFLRTILRKARREEELQVVDDQFGAPTWARLVAEVFAMLLVATLRERNRGEFSSATYHLAAAGATSWHGFAELALREARSLWPDGGWRAERVSTVKATDLAVPAARPRNSRLDCQRLETKLGLRLPDWQEGVRRCLEDMKAMAGSVEELFAEVETP